MPADATLYGGIELGGTKSVLAIGRGDGTIVARQTLPTTEPAQLLPRICAFFETADRALQAIGVGAFGPVVIDPAAPDHGRLLQTNKPGWSGFDLVGALRGGLDLPVALVTDVGAAALAEAHLGALQGTDLGVYLTIGTGIGGAIVCSGRVLPALLHPEMGHVALERHPDDRAPSACAFHANCAEGLAAGPAIHARFGRSLDHFAPGAPAHDLIGDYIGQLCANLVLTLSPRRIVLGGGVSQAPGLIGAAHAAMLARLGGYGAAQVSQPGFLRAPALGQDSGITGALLHAAQDH